MNSAQRKICFIDFHLLASHLYNTVSLWWIVFLVGWVVWFGFYLRDRFFKYFLVGVVLIITMVNISTHCIC